MEKNELELMKQIVSDTNHLAKEILEEKTEMEKEITFLKWFSLIGWVAYICQYLINKNII